MRTEEATCQILVPVNMAPDGSGMNRIKWERYIYRKHWFNAELNTVNIEYWIKLVAWTSSAGDSLSYYFMKYFV